MIQIVPLHRVDADAASLLLDRAFGPDRLTRTAALVRAGATPFDAACLAALDGEQLVGSIAVHLLAWLGEGGAARPLAWLGPLARDPDRVGHGIGVALMDRALAAVDRVGLPVALIGDAPYYQRWGFAADGTGQWAMPGPVARDRLLLRTDRRAPFSGPGRLVARAPAGLPA